MQAKSPFSTIDDRRLRLIGLTLIVVWRIAESELIRSPTSPKAWIVLVIGLACWVAIWEVNRALFWRLRGSRPARQQQFVRLILLFITGIGATTLLFWGARLARGVWVRQQPLDQVVADHVIQVSVNGRLVSLNYYWASLFDAILLFIVFFVVYEIYALSKAARLSARQLAQAQQEKEALEKANLQSQLEALKQQVNPHFLFNSLNSLIALIGEDPRQAEVYAEELSSVYRYLLRSNDQHLTTLATELNFIRSYYHLLQTRHGSALTLVTRIDPGLEALHLPPLTLQLLVENAVKHNVVLPEQPLTIEITTKGEARLIVSNNLQRKSGRVMSNGVGLSNILTKYQLLGQPVPVVQEADGEFSVSLPLVP